MIKAESFIESAREAGFKTYTGVPCSFLTPFINYVIDDTSLNYISSANEGDAVATAAGAVIGGQRSIAMMQNSGLGNAISPLTSLTHIFRIPLLLIITHRGAPDVRDEPQHALMGAITTELLDTMKVPWEVFPDKEDHIEEVLQRAIQYMDTEKRPYALIMKKGTVEPHELNTTVSFNKESVSTLKNFVTSPDMNISRNDCLQLIIEQSNSANSVIIATTGFTGRELYAIDDRDNHLYMVGSMGCASSLGLGLALTRPDLDIITIDGDGAALMRMGNFATIGAYGKGNFKHILLDNGVHDSTGAQQTVSAGVNFAEIARSCGYGISYTGDPGSVIKNIVKKSTHSGPVFGWIKTHPGTIDDLPRPLMEPADVLQRLRDKIEEADHDKDNTA